jgi:hypothetical protein
LGQYSEAFFEQAEGLPMAVFGFEIIKCSEGYFDLSAGLTVDPEVNSDLHAAQMKIQWNVKSREYKKRFEVKEIGLVLDARKLDGKEFGLRELGSNGWKKLFDFINYLKEDLRTKL